MRAPLFLVVLLSLAACDKETDTGEIPDADGDGYNAQEDCNDRDPLIYPGSMETCDGRDEDCDGDIDEDVTVTLYRDQDLDGWGDPSQQTTGCAGTGGYSTEGTDCDDDNENIHPEADEQCDGVDNDCDGTVDEDVEYETWYPDEDMDGYGDDAGATETCVQPGGYIATGGDCDDTDANVNPGMNERCNGVDDDCDDDVDEADAVDAGTWYPDTDGDGYGDAADAGTTGCEHPGGYVADNTDCDDAHAVINPGAQEVCDADDTDEDCDGLADDDDTSADSAGMSTWHPDVDLDGFGATDTAVQACDAPAGHILDDQDCDDSDGAVNPAMEEACNAVDDDCDGLVDDADPGLAVGNNWYADADGDGYGDASAHVLACLQPTGYVADNTDCDDTDATLTTDCGGTDTGDTGGVFTRDGHYEGPLVVDVAVAAMGWTDTCTGTASFDIVSADATPITGTATCTFAGVLAAYGAQSGTFDGSFPSDPDATGNVTIGVLVTDTWDGSFTDDDTLEGTFDGTLIDASGLTFEYAGGFTVAR